MWHPLSVYASKKWLAGAKVRWYTIHGIQIGELKRMQEQRHRHRESDVRIESNVQVYE